jgi:uncharacterized membrane protein YphA (DoxX/SURF4 family)
MKLREFLFLPGNARHADLGLLLLRCVTGAFLIYQSHDNVFFAARMDEFVKFLTHFKFAMPELMAPLSVYAQFAAGIAFILGLFTRWAGLITAFNFAVAVWMVHWTASPTPPPPPRPTPMTRRRSRCSRGWSRSAAAPACTLAAPTSARFTTSPPRSSTIRWTKRSRATPAASR